MNSNRYVPVEINILKCRWFTDPLIFHLLFYFVMKANYCEVAWKEESLSRGELIASYASISEATGLKKGVIERGLKKLVKTGEITKISNNRYTKIKVLNYENYVRAMDKAKEINKKPNRNSEETKKKQSRTDNNKYNDNNNQNNKEVFSPPTLEEVTDYCQKRHNDINPIEFINFYESKGWMIGNNQMKDWKACIRTWEQRAKQVEDMPPWYQNTGVKEMDTQLEKENEKLLEQLQHHSEIEIGVPNE